MLLTILLKYILGYFYVLAYIVKSHRVVGFSDILKTKIAVLCDEEKGVKVLDALILYSTSDIEELLYNEYIYLSC